MSNGENSDQEDGGMDFFWLGNLSENYKIDAEFLDEVRGTHPPLHQKIIINATQPDTWQITGSTATPLGA